MLWVYSPAMHFFMSQPPELSNEILVGSFALNMLHRQRAIETLSKKEQLDMVNGLSLFNEFAEVDKPAYGNLQPRLLEGLAHSTVDNGALLRQQSSTRRNPPLFATRGIDMLHQEDLLVLYEDYRGTNTNLQQSPQTRILLRLTASS